ncbi:glucosamine-6-phosphate deaminase [Virgibacillus necropolis]|uniref:glucosamine-6-phosphate deaminase n=1 Tax=Virgibacillus necropolis TaxID=163877 RepID=UPI00384CC86B
MNVLKVKNYDEMSEKACSILLDKINSVPHPVLGLATGSTPEGLYKKLIEEYRSGEVSFKDTTTFNLDEYIGLSMDHPNSYHHYMKDHLFQHIDIDMEKAHVPNGDVTDVQSECKDYEKIIHENGNIDIQILGIGTNGHIGFNEPGTPFTSRTHIVNLAESTRQANARFFGSIEDVPTRAITMGIETIRESKEIIVLVSGEKKAEALSRFINGDVSESFPASILQKHNNVTIVADEAALSKL